MCLSPLSIINKKRFFNFTKPEQFFLSVPCGKCSECLQTKSNEYKFRLLHEFKECVNNGGFCYFDTLTYSNEYLPHCSDFFDIDSRFDFACFSHKDTYNFINSLREGLKRDDYDVQGNLSYFLVSEYGTSEFCTHRPHYHILFFVRFPISPIDFSKYVSKYWFYGRTDGYSYKPFSYILQHNVFTSVNFSAISYVSKYIQKSSLFQSVIDRRVSHLVDSFLSSNPCSDDYQIKLFRDSISRTVGQFHRQSQFLGISYLYGLDVDSLVDNPFVSLPDGKRYAFSLPLPQYYKRKLFYNQLSFDGRKFWQLNALGNYFFSRRLHSNYKNVRYHLESVRLTFGLDFDSSAFADYLIYKRGRFISDSVDFLPPSFNQYYHDNIFTIFSYCSKLDKFCFSHNRFFTPIFSGYPAYPFKSVLPPLIYKFDEYLNNHVFFDFYFENLIDTIRKLCYFENRKKQDSFNVRQRLTNLFHFLSS